MGDGNVGVIEPSTQLPGEWDCIMNSSIPGVNTASLAMFHPFSSSLKEEMEKMNEMKTTYY